MDRVLLAILAAIALTLVLFACGWIAYPFGILLLLIAAAARLLSRSGR